MQLEGQVAVITGAGSGMGKAMAERFAREGASLILADISGNQDAVAAALGDRAVPVHADVSQEADVEAMIAAAVDRFGRIDVLCNNAGFGGGMAPLHEQTAEKWELVHSANLKGVFFGIKYGAMAMMKTGGGSIVNTTSASGVVGWKGHSIYGAAKAGANHITKAAALDYAQYGIRVNAIAPGTIWTGLVPHSKEHATPPEGIFRIAGIPMDRWGLAEDIASAALFLASKESSYITGVIIPVDGGYSIGFSGMGAENDGGQGEHRLNR